MKLKFWGVRGSIPVPEKDKMKYGGNTSCVYVEVDKDNFIILDAGTGIRQLGNWLLKEKKGKEIKGNIFLSHTHWDHIQGFPFFAPAFIPGNEFTFYGNKNDSTTLEKTLLNQQEYRYFPVKLEAMGAKMHFNAIGQEKFSINGIDIETIYVNHPGVTLSYKIKHNNKTLIYATDLEPVSPLLLDSMNTIGDDDNFMFVENIKKADERLINFFKGADLIIHDAQYTPEEFQQRIGYGHSTYLQAVDNIGKSGVKKWVIFHHDPMHSDEFLEDNILKNAYDYAKEKGYNDMEIILAQELDEIEI